MTRYENKFGDLLVISMHLFLFSYKAYKF